jgi:hypothetical protein
MGEGFHPARDPGACALGLQRGDEQGDGVETAFAQGFQVAPVGGWSPEGLSCPAATLLTATRPRVLITFYTSLVETALPHPLPPAGGACSGRPFRAKAPLPAGGGARPSRRREGMGEGRLHERRRPWPCPSPTPPPAGSPSRLREGRARGDRSAQKPLSRQGEGLGKGKSPKRGGPSPRATSPVALPLPNPSPCRERGFQVAPVGGWSPERGDRSAQKPLSRQGEGLGKGKSPKRCRCCKLC